MQEKPLLIYTAFSIYDILLYIKRDDIGIYNQEAYIRITKDYKLKDYKLK